MAKRKVAAFVFGCMHSSGRKGKNGIQLCVPLDSTFVAPGCGFTVAFSLSLTPFLRSPLLHFLCVCVLLCFFNNHFHFSFIVVFSLSALGFINRRNVARSLIPPQGHFCCCKYMALPRWWDFAHFPDVTHYAIVVRHINTNYNVCQLFLLQL